MSARPPTFWTELDSGRYGLNWHGWEDQHVAIVTGGEYACVLVARQAVARRQLIERMHAKSEENK